MPKITVSGGASYPDDVPDERVEGEAHVRPGEDDPDRFRNHVENGGREPLSEGERVHDGGDGPLPDADGQDGEPILARPPVSALKEDWVAYARQVNAVRGDESDVGEFTKQQLIELYGHDDVGEE